MMTKEQIKKILPEIKEHECPGAPVDGGCEFCPGDCFSYSYKDEYLTKEEEKLMEEIIEEEKK